MIFSLFTDIKLIIKLHRQRSNHTYFFTEFLGYMEESFAGMVLLLPDILFSVDQNPGFHQNLRSHSLGLEKSEVEVKKKYRGKFSAQRTTSWSWYWRLRVMRSSPQQTVLHFRNSQDEARGGGIGAWHTQVRSVIKARRAVENCPNNDSSPVSNLEISPPCPDVDQPCLQHGSLQRGWELCEGNFSPVLQDKTLFPLKSWRDDALARKKNSDSWRCGSYTATSHHTGMDALLALPSLVKTFSASMSVFNWMISNFMMWWWVMQDTQDTHTQASTPTWRWVGRGGVESDLSYDEDDILQVNMGD